MCARRRKIRFLEGAKFPDVLTAKLPLASVSPWKGLLAAMRRTGSFALPKGKSLAALKKNVAGKGAQAFLKLASEPWDRIAAQGSSSEGGWRTPAELAMAKAATQPELICARYFTLRLLGVPARAMRILMQPDRDGGSDLAVLAVAAGSDAFLVDAGGNIRRSTQEVLAKARIGLSEACCYGSLSPAALADTAQKLEPAFEAVLGRLAGRAVARDRQKNARKNMTQ